MAFRAFYNEIKHLKVTELYSHFRPMLSPAYIKAAVGRGVDSYQEKYIFTSSITPLYHVIFGGMALSYLIALPEERRHLEHKLHAAEHAGAAAH